MTTERDSSCLSDEDAVAYVAGTIGDTARVQADLHMDECAACRWLVSALARDAQHSSSDATRSMTLPVREMAIDCAAGELLAGARIDRYQVRAQIGGGGMGIVYAAHDPELRRDVAVKVVRPIGVVAAESQVRLLREAQAMARLSHPGVVPIYDAGAI